MTRIKWFALVRAYGLFLVLGYHLFYDIFPGGFLGVDIFFAFSGFLVTALAIEEVRKSGGFALFNFYKRRARRIIIPLFYAVVFTLPFMLLISPDFTVGIAKQTAAALGFATNWFQIFTGGSYEAQLLPSAYIHTWSLAIEMQFYITWGLLFALLAGVAKLLFEDTKKRLICFKASVLIISGTLAVSSYLYMQSMWSAGHALDVIYFDTFARFLPFFIGAFSAVVWGVQDKQDAASRLPGSHSKLIVAALIIVTVLTSAVIMYESLQYKFTDSFIYHYGFLFTSLLAVVLIYCTHGLHCMTPAEMKEPKLLTATGDLSYNAYLFHWPFYVVFSALIITSNTLASLVTLVFTFTFSALVYYGAERIFISPGHTGALKHRRAVVSAVSIAVVFSAAAGGFVMHRAPAITSIEADFAASYVMQDAGGVMSLKRGIMAVNDTPLTYTPLQANLLSVGVPMPIPAPASPPAPETASPSAPAPTPPPAPAPQPTPAPETITNPIEVFGGVTVIGDSVPLGAQGAMQSLIPDCYVDALVSRPVSAGHGIMTSLIQSGQLGECLVIALGTNGAYNYESLLTRIIDDLPAGHRLIFVTPFDGRSNENSTILNNTAEWMRGLPNQYDFITIADWNALIRPQVELLAGDRVHMGGQTSMNLYAGLVADAVAAALQKPSKAE